MNMFGSYEHKDIFNEWSATWMKRIKKHFFDCLIGEEQAQERHDETALVLDRQILSSRQQVIFSQDDT